MKQLQLGIYSAPLSAGGSLILDATPFVVSCRLSTNDHGFEGLTTSVLCTLASSLRLYDQVGIPYVALTCGGQILWEGRLEDPTLAVGGQGSGLTVQALGYWRAMSDIPYTAFWSTSKVDAFRPIVDNELAVIAPAIVRQARFAFDTQNRVWIAPEKNSTQGITTAVRGYQVFQISTSGPRIVGLQFDYEFFAPVNWQGFWQTFDSDLTAVVQTSAAIAGTGALATGSIHTTLTACGAVSFLMRFNAADAVFAGETGSAYFQITNIRIVTSTTNRVNTTLTVARTNGAGVTCTVGSTARMYIGQRLFLASGANSESVIVQTIPTSTTFTATVVNAPGGGYPIGTTVQAHIIYADEIAASMVNGISGNNPTQLSSSTALIQSPGLDLLDENFDDAFIPDELTRLVALGDSQATPRQWEVGVWEDRKLFFRPQLTVYRAWFVDATDLQIARTLEDLANSVYAVYQDPSGATERTAVVSDATSITRYGVQRRLALATNTTSATQAGVQRNAALADQKDPKPRATIQFDAVYDASGARYPLWLVRTGDTMTIRNLPPNLSTSVDRIRTFRITHTSYDAMADALDVEPERPPRTLEVMLARREEGITQ